MVFPFLRIVFFILPAAELKPAHAFEHSLELLSEAFARRDVLLKQRGTHG
jgi:hypothetical protein